ncbi:uncharacterized protein A1O5_01552 [Cladophialophora psammophila CBS 110553]|uniref:Fungal N-terminal domain-containing protein n=1 Tax=Cladophialophora psammophila CBS 110553 TaxID=1182543 RepID=W9XD40_9EURO|nr:uncharacterized protein A1O5_01552 [Cladophialophora psammophila CBS 110553]EXJ74856.1 hypothetical protein A1O5_01552 [Cladophialophora psammophila CBS 110553]
MGPSIHHPRKELGGYHQHAQVAAAYEDCRQTFDQLSSVMEANRQVWEGNADFLESFKNSLVHWANVHHAENGSLDHALRKSSDLRDRVVDLLESLNHKLQNGKYPRYSSL